jgi:hypothetical protein
MNEDREEEGEDGEDEGCTTEAPDDRSLVVWFPLLRFLLVPDSCLFRSSLLSLLSVVSPSDTAAVLNGSSSSDESELDDKSSLSSELSLPPPLVVMLLMLSLRALLFLFSRSISPLFLIIEILRNVALFSFPCPFSRSFSALLPPPPLLWRLSSEASALSVLVRTCVPA